MAILKPSSNLKVTNSSLEEDDLCCKKFFRVDCKPEAGEDLKATSSAPYLLPEVELKRMSLSMISSTSTVIDGNVSSSSIAEVPDVQSTAPSAKMDRERTPYSVAPEG